MEGLMEPLISNKTLREDILGVSPVTWWHWQKQGKLPKSIKINRRRYFRRCDVEAWLEELASPQTADNK
jgi:predicted DNA-binding transcriptional regulator AlpA